MSEEKLRLEKLIEHWIEHNDEHGNRFIDEANKAERLGFMEAAEEMKNAAKASRSVSDHLWKAFERIKDSDL
ncbi:hypothetical protein E2P71_01890 [Candidatus Bathyarchaeota archaeon]|nr:hypothetical protein E2P71_01890 [Candidatus Bathyarchaeota archaeon]